MKPASIYPSSIDVSGQEGITTNVSVTLHGLSHQNIEDLAVLLVGPNGDSVVLIASYAKGLREVWSNETLTFDEFGESVECPEPEGTFKTGRVWKPSASRSRGPVPLTRTRGALPPTNSRDEQQRRLGRSLEPVRR